MAWTLRLQGVGNAFAVELGSAMATLERDGIPWLTIDCGGEGLSHYLEQYDGAYPSALFLTHAHLDHVSGFERLFVSAWFSEARRGRVKLYVPAPLLPLLHQRIGEYPNVLAEGGVNLWDAFQVIPVGEAFWHQGVRLEVFPVRHHWPQSAFGLRLKGSLVWTGDTRPIPEMLARYADDNELVAHDCALHGNPSHSGVDDLEREYPPALLQRCLLYHYASTAEGEQLAARGHRVAHPGEVIILAEPTALQAHAGQNLG
ncbi:MBL fold metallo-hydrolase [Pseudoxanthomonas kalamensis DSM 18571]|uniref:MBL fold metallo-hydrolase n=1 Tax=Pseudoxanthomonas kalamensis TaxID=289483 RepID=UPI001391D2B8|nr:MBL fold metallo-hydrolase [Pseudoxanthomonas kalamensis]KAF1709918.1 MBL fold metallo-hydrolase [Pseudoxanthomonas kalamensis DSM 18571]